MSMFFFPGTGTIEFYVAQEDLRNAGYELLIHAEDHGYEVFPTQDWVEEWEYKISVWDKDVPVGVCFHGWHWDKRRRLWMALLPEEFERVITQRGVKVELLP